MSSTYLKRRPVTAVTTIAVDDGGYFGRATDSFPATSELTSGTHFALADESYSEENQGQLLRTDGVCWSLGNGNIKAVYTGGYDADNMPDDLKVACFRLCDIVRSKRGKFGPAVSKTYGRFSYQLLAENQSAGGGDLSSVLSILDGYKEIAV